MPVMTIASLAAVMSLMPLGPLSEHPPVADPCGLLTIAEVQQTFPGTKAGRLDRAQEKNGILTCVWDYPTGQLSIIGDTKNDEAEDSTNNEAEAWTLTFLDPLRNDAGRHVRYENLTGVGDEAIAVVEREDKAKGFLINAAIVVVRRGKRQVVAISTDLARRERADALRALSDLGKAIAKRLN